MNTNRHLPSARRALATAALAALALANPSAHAVPVWNVNIGTELTPSDNFTGAAPENTANSFWNSVTTANPTAMPLADSTETVSSATLTLTGSFQFTDGGWAAVTGPEIFSQWSKSSDNATPFGMVIGGLGASNTYDLIIYSDWYWKGDGTLPLTQTVGSGLTGTIVLDQISSGANGDVPDLVEDTDPGANGNIEGNWLRITGLTPDGSGNLGFSMGGTNAAFNGFQLIQMGGGPPDTTPPTPNPMTWASAPAAASSSSITMTATTASDASGVEYLFTETSNNPGATSSGWQNSPVYTDTGLNPSTTYTYTVKARDKSPALHETGVSGAASATTNPPPSGAVVWNVNIGSQITTADNYAGAIPQSTPINWNSITSSSYTGLALKDSTGSTAGGITLDLTSDRAAGGQALTSGDKIFIGYFGGAGAASTMTLRGLTLVKTYDILFYSDWYWKNGDSLPITQTAGTGLSGTFHLNRILSGTNGTVPALTQDTNPANVTSGAGNIGNYCRIVGIVPEADGKVSFRMGDGANTAFSGFQFVQTGDAAPRADILTFGLPGNPAVISGTHITLALPYGSNVTSLAPTFTLWPGATCVPVSGTALNFTSPQTYTVTSSDSLVTKIYTVTAVIAPPLPEFTLTAPAAWDGRQTITVQPDITNLALLQATGGTNFNYQWSVSGVAVTKQVSPGVLTLTRSQGSGPLVVTLTMDNGTTGVTNSTTIDVQEPATDPWVERTPGATEKPVTGQFFARNPFSNLGTIHYNGIQSGSPDTVYLKVYKTPSGGSETLETTHRQSLVGGAYAFSAPIAAGLISYRVVYGTTTGGVDTDVDTTVTDLVCGDAYIIEGQSNAVATDNSAPRDGTTSPWIRTYGRAGGAWGSARSKASDPFWEMNVGLWGMELAKSMVTGHQIPVCFINGAVGGTRIDEHQAHPANHTVAGGLYSIYANLLNRVIGAKLTHGIRGIFWHQGESDCSNFGPILDYDYTVYEQNFLNMSDAWKQDYPNLQRYLIYQVMPKPCGIGPKGDQLREVQRNLPRLYSKMSILNTLGIEGYEGCHFSAAGYANMANRTAPVVGRDFYGVAPGAPVTAPNLKRAYFTTSDRTAIALEFDQTMSWSRFSLPNYYVDKTAGKVTSGSASGNLVTLQLSGPAAVTATLDYLEDNYWNQGESVSSLLYGANAIPALTFADVPIGTLTQYESWSGTRNLSGASAAGDADPDHDGVQNALEYVLGGEPNPAAADSNSAALLPYSTPDGAGDLVFTFQRKVASVGGVDLTFQWAADLTFPPLNSVPIGAAGSTVDGIHVAITHFDAATDMIVITVPAAKAAGGKLFGRLHAIVP
ncbi:MAG: hypothetical protein K9N23_07945 [Akkermansiaceae bacterium]|nr:hypothetical protein [Akkermansiaceae bacterium]